MQNMAVRHNSLDIDNLSPVKGVKGNGGLAQRGISQDIPIQMSMNIGTSQSTLLPGLREIRSAKDVNKSVGNANAQNMSE